MASRSRSFLGPYPFDFYLVVISNFFFFGSFQWSFVALPGFIQEIGGDAAQIGLAYGLSTLSAVLVRPAMGRLVDRWGRKTALLVGAAIFTLEPILYTLVPSVWPFLAVRLLRGLGIAAFTTAYTALVTDLAAPERRGEAVGISGITNNLGMLFMPALGVLIQEQWGYDWHFWAAAAVAAGSLLSLLPVEEPLRHEPTLDEETGFWPVARRRPIWVAALGGTGLAVAYGAMLSFMPPLAEGRGLTAAGSFFTAFALAMMACQAVAGWLSDRIGRRAVAVPGMIAAAVASGGLAAAHSNAALLAAGAGLGLSWGLVRAGLDTAVADAVSQESRGTALAVLYTLFDVGIGAGSFGLGLVAQAESYGAVFYAAASWAVVALAGYFLWSRRV